MPNPLVRIGFDLSALGGPTLFTLNDPVQGELDSEYVLGGQLFQDVTGFVRSVSIRRGRSRRLDKFQTGTATVVFDNTERVFDPVHAGSPFAGQIKPRRPITIQVGNEFLFSGLIEDWNLDYGLNNDSTAVVSCVDGFVLLAGAELDEFTNVQQLPGDRIEAILNRPEVSWPTGSRDIESGSQLLQGDTVSEGTGVLNYLQLVEETESGALFVSAGGVLTFKGSNTPGSAITDIVFTNLDEGAGTVPYDGIVGYDDDVPYAFAGLAGDLVGYSSIAVEFGTEVLFNRAIVQREGSATIATADNVDSQIEFGVSSLARQNLLFSSDDQLEPTATFLVNRYGEPQVRIRQVGVTVEGDAVSQRLLGLDFGDVVRARFTPNRIGDPIDQFLTVEGVEHSIDSVQHRMSFDFGLITFFPFELDSTDYGILDTNVLGL